MTNRGIYSRRSFLVTAGATAGVAAFRKSSWAADATDPRVARIVEKTIGIDTHNHIDVPLSAAELPGPDIDIAGEMKRSGLSAICAAFATDYRPGDAYDRFLTGLNSLDRQLKLNGMTRSLTADDVVKAHRQHRPTVIQAVEGAHFLQGHLERVKEAHDRGVRHLGLLHDSDAPVPLGDVYTNPPKFNGLTPFGTSVIQECNRVGMLVDLAHASMKTTQDAVKVSTRPMVFSHTGLNTRLGADARLAKTALARLISKEQAKLVADAGGAVGVWPHLTDTALEYAQNIRAMVDAIGTDHVCIGSDTKLTPPTPRPPRPPGSNPTPHPGELGGIQPGFRPGQKYAQIGERTNLAWVGETAGFYYCVVDAMLKTGFTPEEIGKIGGGNYLRIFGEACKLA